jgi:hypothetical protein
MGNCTVGLEARKFCGHGSQLLGVAPFIETACLNLRWGPLLVFKLDACAVRTIYTVRAWRVDGWIDLAGDFTARADLIPLLPLPPHAMSDVDERWGARINATSNTIISFGALQWLHPRGLASYRQLLMLVSSDVATALRRTSAAPFAAVYLAFALAHLELSGVTLAKAARVAAMLAAWGTYIIRSTIKRMSKGVKLATTL